MLRNLILIILLGLVICSSNAQQLVGIPIPGSTLTLNVVANPLPLQHLNNNPSATNVTMTDDGNKHVPLGFNFPYFGKNFNKELADFDLEDLD